VCVHKGLFQFIFSQLNSSQTRVHTPDRSSGELPAEHQLV
jgi:hypothetical protein